MKKSKHNPELLRLVEEHIYKMLLEDKLITLSQYQKLLK
jgi:hypothetical protein